VATRRGAFATMAVGGNAVGANISYQIDDVPAFSSDTTRR
jgi:hypothetical protein